MAILGIAILKLRVSKTTPIVELRIFEVLKLKLLTLKTIRVGIILARLLLETLDINLWASILYPALATAELIKNICIFYTLFDII